MQHMTDGFKVIQAGKPQVLLFFLCIWLCFAAGTSPAHQAAQQPGASTTKEALQRCREDAGTCLGPVDTRRTQQQTVVAASLATAGHCCGCSLNNPGSTLPAIEHWLPCCVMDLTAVHVAHFAAVFAPPCSASAPVACLLPCLLLRTCCNIVGLLPSAWP